MNEPLPLPTRFLAHYNRENGGIWSYLDRQRVEDEKPIVEGVFAAYETYIRASAAYTKEHFKDLSGPALVQESIKRYQQMAVLAPWRIGQDVYRFDPDLYEALIQTEQIGEVPAELLRRLPAWGVYIELRDFQFNERRYQGLFAAPTCNEKGEPHVDMIFVNEDLFISALVLPLTGTIQEGLDTLVHTAGFDIASLRSDEVARAISLVLYLASEPPEEAFPLAKPTLRFKRVKGLERLYPAEEPKVWDVGQRIGAALRSAVASAHAQSSGEGGSVRPHLRRAHWHTYWYGPRKAATRERKVRWLHPILVRGDALWSFEELPTVEHRVEKSWHGTP